MYECRHCGEFLRRKEGRARCPRCRMPWFEKPEWPRGVKNPEDTPCAAHPHNLAAGFCRRCGAAICLFCRTRWFEQPLCPACTDRAIQTHEKHPDEIRTYQKQSTWALVFALTAWVLFLLGAGLLLFLRQSGPQPPWFFLAKFFILGCLAPALFGVGNGLAASQIPGPGFRKAFAGFLLSSSLVGLLLGAMIYNTWQN